MRYNSSIELERLVNRAKNGDEKAKENIIMIFKPFIKIYVQDVLTKPSNENDLISMGMLMPLNAIQNYDINKNNFIEYVEIFIKNSFKYEIKNLSL